MQVIDGHISSSDLRWVENPAIFDKKIDVFSIGHNFVLKRSFLIIFDVLESSGHAVFIFSVSSAIAADCLR